MPDLPEDLYVFVYQNEDESTELVGFPLRSPDDWVVCAFRSPRSAYNFLKARRPGPKPNVAPDSEVWEFRPRTFDCHQPSL